MFRLPRLDLFWVECYASHDERRLKMRISTPTLAVLLTVVFVLIGCRESEPVAPPANESAETDSALKSIGEKTTDTAKKTVIEAAQAAETKADQAAQTVDTRDAGDQAAPQATESKAEADAADQQALEAATASKAKADAAARQAAEAATASKAEADAAARQAAEAARQAQIEAEKAVREAAELQRKRIEAGTKESEKGRGTIIVQ